MHFLLNIPVFISGKIPLSLQANGYDNLPANFRRTALRDHTFWFVVAPLPSDLNDLVNASSVLDNVCVLNLNVTTAESISVSIQTVDFLQSLFQSCQY
jgi:hypothetical protein